MHSCYRKHILAVTTIVALTLCGASTARASLLVDFLPQPASDEIPEFIWDGDYLLIGPGAVGTGLPDPNVPGDGDLPPDQQSAGGLLITTPFVIPGLPGGEVRTTSGTTDFYDVTLEFEPLGADGAPEVSVSGFVTQQLVGGRFNIWTTDPVNAGAPGDPEVNDPVLLLSGQIANAAITGIHGAHTGAVLSAEVAYDGGVIRDAAAAEFGPGPLVGSLSWTLLDIAPMLLVDGGQLAAFDADATGQFSGLVVPEPATLGLLCFTAPFVLRIKSRRQ